MPFSDYSTNPDANISLGGINIGPGAPAANVDNAIRRLAADGKLLSDQVGSLGDFMPKSGGVFTNTITRSGSGAYRFATLDKLVDGREDFLPEGSPLPAGGEGRVVYFYTG